MSNFNLASLLPSMLHKILSKVTTSHLRDFGSARTAFSGFNQIGREEYYYRSADLFNLNDWIDEANALRTFRLRCYQAGNLEAIYIRVMYEFFVLHLLDEGREKICLAGERGLLWAKSTGAIDSSQFQAYLDKIRENYIRLMEDNSRDKMDPVINRNDGGTKKREEEAGPAQYCRPWEEAGMNMLRRRRERLMRHLRRRRQKKQFKSEEEESFTSSSDSDEEMNISLAEVKRLMENMISTLKSKEEEEFINTNAVKIEDSKAEEMNIADDEENMFPRTRGRLVRYLGRHKSKPQDSSFQIEFHHLQLPSDDE
ncbi:unnamed protein product [Brassica rapa]|uniref:F-box domain-containing protein n=1 Tax=Brassica campestris TaxID=3711 RepID=A0A8D9HZU3_BRACM|nr:unnamed protein product [Brassica rapa]